MTDVIVFSAQTHRYEDASLAALLVDMTAHRFDLGQPTLMTIETDRHGNHSIRFSQRNIERIMSPVGWGREMDEHNAED